MSGKTSNPTAVLRILSELEKLIATSQGLVLSKKDFDLIETKIHELQFQMDLAYLPNRESKNG